MFSDMNDWSSRSHSIYQLQPLSARYNLIKKKTKKNWGFNGKSVVTGATIASKINLVDLARARSG